MALRHRAAALTIPLLALLGTRAWATDATPEPIEVTATRIPEPVLSVPASVTVIDGQDLRDRQVHDLAGALALVSGVEAPPGGDAGPASAVPSLLGLHEFDAFLLVVDGVPWGGAFNPSIATLDLTDVQRIEVLKGSAPVTFGATAFVGVIQVIHAPAGAAEDRVVLGGGTNGNALGTLSVALPRVGDYAQSLTLQGASGGFADAREAVSDGKLLYRGALPVGGGSLRIDLDLTDERTVPTSPVVRTGAALTTLTPLDANANPADARIDENRFHGVLGYTRPTALGMWETTVSYAFSEITDIRGFLRPTLIDDGSANADSQRQARRIEDGYLDTHLASTPVPGVTLLAGADLLYGLGKQISRNGEYYAPLSGDTVPPPTTALHVDEINSLSDQRLFAGQYLQADWQPDARLDVFAGLRVNETSERQDSLHVDGFDPGADLAGASNRHVVRLTDAVGASYAVWRGAGSDRISPYADYRDSFKPAAIDFGPDYTPLVLQPETARNYEAGVKGSLLQGRLSFDLDTFYVDFRNLVVATTDAQGDAVLQNAGGQHLRGAEMQVQLRPVRDLTLTGEGSYHDARFTRYVATEGGANVDASGKQLPLAPHWLAGAGVRYAPARGLFGSAIVDYVGRRDLDLANTAVAAGYATVSASAGYRFGAYELLVSGSNLSDARPPVTQSEFGDDAYYRLSGRLVLVSLAARL